MPRPRADSRKIRQTLLEAAEKRLAKYGSSRISVTELAAECGMSQSNVYRFFPNKAALIAALADRWFVDIEAELRKAIDSADNWQTKLQQFVLVQLALKSSRFDQDPQLFRTYLALAEKHPEPVLLHVARLENMLTAILSAAFDRESLDAARTIFLKTQRRCSGTRLPSPDCGRDVHRSVPDKSYPW
ncbi:TetR/AcrR family transcriptional regulator [Roseibium salinum]|nr:TetR/AcrR family transcriptional regulator [Roseibium salinum]